MNKKCGWCFIYPSFSLERKDGGHDGERGMYLLCGWLRSYRTHEIQGKSGAKIYVTPGLCHQTQNKQMDKTNWPFNSNEIHWENPTHRVDIHKQTPATLFLLRLIAPETTGENMIQSKEMNNDLSIGPLREISIIYFFICIFPRSLINLIKITSST